MKNGAGKISFRNVVSVLSIVSFLTVAQGAAMTALAAEWDLWPKGRGKDAPVAKPETPEAAAAAKAGETAGKTTAAGTTAGTVGKGALIAAGLIGVGLAVGGGGGGGTTTAHH